MSISLQEILDGLKVGIVWEKGQIIPGYSPNDYRRDACGAIISRSSYGQHTAYGWEIDHIYPRSAGGSDSFDNLQPLHWQNNRAKGDSLSGNYCVLGIR